MSGPSPPSHSLFCVLILLSTPYIPQNQLQYIIFLLQRHPPHFSLSLQGGYLEMVLSTISQYIVVIWAPVRSVLYITVNHLSLVYSSAYHGPH